MRVIGQDFFLPDLHFGKTCIFLNKIETKVKLTLFTSTFKHVINCCDKITRLQIPAAQAKTG